MTSDTTIRPVRGRQRKSGKHIVVSRRGKTQSRNARLVIWLAGWQIEIWDQDEQSGTGS